MPGNQAASLATGQPEFWYGNDVGWSVLARIDGQTYNLFGVTTDSSSTTSATTLSANYTSTHSIFIVEAGSETVTLDFFSPVSFDDYIRQSLPFSFLSVSVTGTASSVQIYSAIDENWTGQSLAATCSHSTSGNASIHELSANGATYAQSADEMALWGTAVYAVHSLDNTSVSFGSGSASALQEQFASDGSLSSSTVSCSENGFHGFAYQLGASSDTPSTVTFAAGVVREDAINYFGSPETHYYRTAYPDIASAVNYFFDDYEDAAAESHTLDLAIETTATSLAGSNYSDILTLSTRQVFGAIDLTVPGDSLNTSEAKAFVKEISSDGNLNTVDIIYPLFPFFYVFAPEWIKLLTDPVLKYSQSGQYPFPWAVHDLGANYPNATGHNNGNDEHMPIEESGNLIILVKAYEYATGDTTWAAEYAEILKQWANYLADNGLYPAYQLSTTDGLGAFTNMTSLAVKAAVGLSAYGNLTGQQNWTSLGESFAKTITTPGIGIEDDSENLQYFDLTYQDTGTFYLTFNIFPALLLDLSTFNASVYEAESAFYPTVRQSLGVPIDGAVQWGKTDWDHWTAAVCDNTTAQMFVDDVWTYLSNGLNTEPFSDRYWVSGDDEGLAVFRARPTVGAHWAIWARQLGPNSGGL